MVYLAEIRDEMQQPILRAGAAARHLQIPLPDRGEEKHRPLLIIVYTFSIFKISTVRIFQ